MGILHERGLRPKTSYGQHFLTDRNMLRLEVREARIQPGETVLEIGPGYGSLTVELARVAKKVVAVELDPEMADELEITLREKKIENVKVIRGDILSVELPEWHRCVSNIPYNLSSQITEWLGLQGKPALIMYQKEFAERLVARPGDRAYSRITILAQYYFVPEIVRIVNRRCFVPPPKVDSALVRLTPREEKPDVGNPEFFFWFVGVVFRHRNQKLWKALSNEWRELERLGVKNKKMAEELGKSLPFRDKRPRHMTIEDLATVSKKLEEMEG